MGLKLPRSLTCCIPLSIYFITLLALTLALLHGFRDMPGTYEKQYSDLIDSLYILRMEEAEHHG